MLRVFPGAERAGTNKRAGCGAMIGQAKDKSLLLSHSLAPSMDFLTHPAGLFGRRSQLKSGLHKKLSVHLIFLQGCLLQSMVGCLQNSALPALFLPGALAFAS